MLALYIAGAAAGYLFGGAATGAYAYHKFESHERGVSYPGEVGPWVRWPSTKGTCDACFWQGFGIIWPLFWAGMLIRGMSVVPFRYVLGRLSAPKLPQAKPLQEKR